MGYDEVPDRCSSGFPVPKTVSTFQCALLVRYADLHGRPVYIRTSPVSCWRTSVGMFNQDQDVNVSCLALGHMLLPHSQEKTDWLKSCVFQSQSRRRAWGLEPIHSGIFTRSILVMCVKPHPLWGVLVNFLLVVCFCLKICSTKVFADCEVSISLLVCASLRHVWNTTKYFSSEIGPCLREHCGLILTTSKRYLTVKTWF